MGDLSEHFSRAEFDCHNGERAHPDPELVQRLELLRAAVTAKQGRPAPLRIISGYRSRSYNASIGGARESQHIYNRAADIPAGYATVAQAQAAGFRGIGYCGHAVVHLDVRPGPAVIFEDC